MENNSNTSLEILEVRNLPEFQGWKEKQLAIVQDNPFVAIENHQTYELAKKSRTALVSARTSIQNQDKIVAKKLKELRTEAGKVAEELISITQPHEEKQQEEVKRYEAEREAERLEKARIEQERKDEIQKDINDLYDTWKNEIRNIEHLRDCDNSKEVMESRIAAQEEKDMEEFELDFAEKTSLLRNQFAERLQYLTEQEEARKERKKLAAERAELERLKKEAEEQRAKEDAERKAREEKEQAEKKAREEKEQAEKKAREEKERLAREEEDKKIRAEREAEAEKLRKEREELEAEKKRIADQKAKEEAEAKAKEAEAKAKEEAARKAKEEAEAAAKLKAEEEAKSKRLEELKPDKEKLLQFAESLANLDQEVPNLEDVKSRELAKEIQQSLQDWKSSILDRIENFK